MSPLLRRLQLQATPLLLELSLDTVPLLAKLLIVSVFRILPVEGLLSLKPLALLAHSLLHFLFHDFFSSIGISVFWNKICQQAFAEHRQSYRVKSTEEYRN